MALCGTPVPPPPVYPPDDDGGPPPSQWVQLCDDNGAFRRRYDYDTDGNPAGHADYTLDGEPYEPVGDVRDCDTGDECASPTEPVATTGLCLADGTPIAVVTTRDCDGVVSTEGWIDLQTGDYHGGLPPEGARACGSPQSIQVSGTFCDIDPDTGDVLGLVLVEYQYDTDGAIESVRLVDATTGETYEPQGSVTVCPAGVEQPDPDLIELCDVTDDGTVTRFVRDYRRDENNLIAGHTDYTLDGDPYTVAGTVTACEGEPVVCVPGSTTDGTYTAGVVEVAPELASGEPLNPGTQHEAPGMGILADGGTWHITPTNCGVGDHSGQDAGVGAVQLPPVARPECDDGTATVRITMAYRQDGPDPGQASTGGLTVYYHDTNGTPVAAGSASLPYGAPVGAEGVLEVAAQVPAEQVAAGQVFAYVAAETWQKSWNQPPKCKGWQFTGWSASYAFDTSGCEPQTPQLAQRVQLCTSDDNPIPVEPRPGVDTELLVLCDVDEDGTRTPFVRTVQTDAATGAQRVIADTTLDGEPYEVVGEVGTCEPAGCDECQSVVLCDQVPTDPAPPELDFEAIPLAELPDGPTDGVTDTGVSWSVNCGEYLSPQGHYTIYPIGGTGEPQCVQRWEFDQPVYLRFGVRGFNVSPRECLAYTTDGEVVVEYMHPNHRQGDNPTNSICGLGSATDETILVTTEPVTWLELEAVTNWGQGRGPGLVEVALPPEPIPGDTTPRAFLRTYCRDCDGNVTTTDTELDGVTSYEPVGEVTVCAPAGGGEPGTDEPCRDTTSTLLCDVAAVDRVTVFDPANVPGSDGWEVVAFDGAADGYGPEEAMPYPAQHPAERSAYMGARADLWAGPGPTWDSYETAPIRWVLRKTFEAAEDGIAVVESIGFRGDGGARVRVNGTDAGMYGQWNQPATSGTAQIPVTAGPNTIEIEVRDVSGDNWVTGRLDVAMPRTTQFLRTVVMDCDTGDIVSTTDTTLDGEPYEVVGEVGQCEPTAQCCEPPVPEARVVVETALRCLLDADGAVLGEVLVERVYDDQSGDLIEQRHVDPDTNEPVEIPEGARVGQCVTPCRDTSSTLLCDEGGGTETAVLDVATLPDGPTGGTLSNGVEWTVNAGRVLGNNASYGVFGDGGEPSGPQRWEFDQPVELRVGFSGLNRDDECLGIPSYLEPEQIHASHVWDPVARTLCSVAEVPAEDTSTFVTTMPVSVFEWSNLSPAGAASGVALLEATVTEAPTQFRRTVVMDCETHQVVDVIDTTLDGEPYEVVGEVGQCQTAGGGECCPPPEPQPSPDLRCREHILCDTGPDGDDPITFMRTICRNSTGEVVSVTDTELDATTPYTVRT